MKNKTERALKDWRDGQVNAERLCADVLMIDGYSSIDPQCPLGGPDGTKDILCKKNGWKYVGAVYFPTGEKTFNQIKQKFIEDLSGVKKNTTQGIVFLTNQKISPAERESLKEIAGSSDAKAIIFHIEKIRTILDNPEGLSCRLRLLGIKMSKADQISFFARWDNIFSQEMQSQSEHIISALSEKIDAMAKLQQRSCASLPAKTFRRSSEVSFYTPATHQVTHNLTISLICMLHSSIFFEDSTPLEIGRLRKIQVFVGTKIDPLRSYIPPEPEEIQDLLETLLEEWNNNYSVLLTSDRTQILKAITSFHHELVRIHPFVDGNGRLARYILMLQASELLKITRKITLDNSSSYLNALKQADAGDPGALNSIITQAFYGIEN